MELKIINKEGKGVGVLAVSEEQFARPYNEALVHQVVTGFLANARSGNRAQKTRSEIAKSTRKPWKQKGTGRARAGMASSPIWRGGGRTFPNSPDENFTHKINRKMYRAAFASIVSQLIRDDRFIIADDLNIDAPKTKSFVQILKNMSLANGKVLMVVHELTENLFLASRNLPNVLVLEAHQVDPYSLLRYDAVVYASNAIEKLQEQLA
jgi:large subunit ribosomal protein L4